MTLGDLREPQPPSLLSNLMQRAIELMDLAVARGAVRDRLVRSTLELVPCQGPCSLFHMTGFYGDGGMMDTKQTKHLQVPGGPLGAFMGGEWEKHVRKRDSPIERALHAQSKVQPVGSGSIHTLLREDEWIHTPEGRLATRLEIHDMAYMWIRCSTKALWAVSLRRYRREPRFTPQDVALLDMFAQMLHGSLEKWYLAKMDDLTPREQDVVIDWINHGDMAKVAAKRLGMSVNTHRKHTAAIRRKTGKQTTAGVLAFLGIRTMPDHLG